MQPLALTSDSGEVEIARCCTVGRVSGEVEVNASHFDACGANGIRGVKCVKNYWLGRTLVEWKKIHNLDPDRAIIAAECPQTEIWLGRIV